MGYLVTFSFFCLSFLTRFIPELSRRISYAAEYIQCFSIRFLLKIQPWLRCDENFQDIYGFYDCYKTRKIMFVSNHRSNLDTFILISLIPGLRGLAKSTLYYNIFFMPIMLAAGFVAVRKGNINGFLEGLRKLKTKILDMNKAVLIFPETTRCKKNFNSINKFSSAIFEVAIDTSAIVVPIFIHGTDQLLGRGDFFLNPYSPVKFKILNPIPANQFVKPAELSKYVWGLLALEQVEQQKCS